MKREWSVLSLVCAVVVAVRSVPADTPEAAKPHYEAGLAAKQAKDYPKAIAELKQAIELHKDYADAHWALAWVYAAAGDTALAAEEFREVLRLAPADSDKAHDAKAALDRITSAPPPTKQLPPELQELQELFQRDPLAAYDRAARMFEERRKRGDLDGMMAILRVVADWEDAYGNVPAFDRMTAAAAVVAERDGRWRELGEIWYRRALLAMDVGGDTQGQPLGHPADGTARALYFAEQALAAYEKAGMPPPDTTAYVKARYRDYKGLPTSVEVADGPSDLRLLLRDWKERWQKHSNQESFFLARRTWHDIPKLPGEHRRLLEAAAEAKRTGQDGEAVQVALSLLRNVDADAGLSPEQLDILSTFLPFFLPLPDGEALLPQMRRLISRSIEAGGGCETYLLYLPVLCCGKRNTALSELLRCIAEISNGATCYAPHYVGCVAGSLHAWGRRSDAAWALTVSLQAAQLLDTVNLWYAWRGKADAANYVFPDTPVELRERALALTMNAQVWLAIAEGKHYHNVGFAAHRLLALCEGQRQHRGLILRLGDWLLEAAARLPKTEDRVSHATKAATFYEKGGRNDLAERARALGTALASSSPEALAQITLIAARAAAAGQQWEEVETGLEAALRDGTLKAPRDQLDATMLVLGAKWELGKGPEAQALAAKAAELAGQVELPPPERTSLLVTLASLVPDPRRKSDLLQEAAKVAADAGLDMMKERVTQQISEVAVEAGDTAAAERALVEIIQRQEAARDRLAFDPLLRQQWFADSLGAYRKLLKVAALQGDAALALDCAERMRARVLLDQLAWRKVDLGVRLPKAVQDRLQALREMRRETYALLQQATGAATEAGGGERGAYMPIRGLYLPIRGPLDSQPAPPADYQTRLKTMLTSLAQEETALESAIREAIPAYQRASQVTIPTGEQLAKALSRDAGLAVLEYTLCDEGVVLVGLRGSRAPQTAIIKLKGNALWEQIGRFRQLIWERKPEVTTEAQALHATLVAPMAPLLAGAQRLCVVADGALQLIPFGALMDKDGKYLAERMVVSSTPSLSLALASRGPRPKPDLPALVVAAPETGAVQVPGDERGAYLPIRGMYLPVRGAYLPIRGEGEVSDALTSMAAVPLPGARAEGEAVAKQFAGAKLLSGQEATKAALLEQGRTCDILHIATHGYADPEVPEFSGLLFAGSGDKPYEVLTAQEVYLWDLRARLVTLSACQTGLGKTVEGEGLLGLTRAFIYAGAQDVVCSLWPVSDESTQKLMEAFYAALQRGVTVEEALTEAQRSLLADPATSHPFYWAAFVPVRGPG